MTHMTPNNSDVYDTSGKGTFSINGKMPMFNRPIATPQTAAANMASLKSAIAQAMGAKPVQEDWTDSIGNASQLAQYLNQYQNTGEIPPELQALFNNMPMNRSASGKKRNNVSVQEDWTDSIGNASQLAQELANYQNSGEASSALQAFFDANNINFAAGSCGMNEDYLTSLFDGENLSEDFKFKTKTIFEAALNEKVLFIEKNILQASKEIIEEQVIANTKEIVEQVDQYLNYVISEWMEENKVAVERGLRTEIAENFINGLKDLFESSFIDVPQEKYNVLDDLFDVNSELKESLNGLMRENISLKNEINARLCAEAFMEETAGLADTQIEKLAKLAEGIEFENPKQYRQKVSLLKESYFNSNKTPRNTNNTIPMLTEDMDSSSVLTENSSDPMVSTVANTISVLNKNSPKVEKVFNTPSSARLAGLINQGVSRDNFI